MRKIVFFLLPCVLIFLCTTGNLFGSHIVGGEMTYRYLGSGNYQIRLTVFRDCFNGVPDFDMPAVIGIFDANDSLLGNFNMQYLGKTTVPPVINSPCIVPPTNVCYEVTTYIDTVNLPPLAGGYTLSYMRCCRNASISNISNPGNVGATYYAHIPGPAITTNNSSPFFINLPPTFICSGFPFTFNNAAFDYNGDSLVYDLVTPVEGGTAGFTASPPFIPPPYPPVTWASGFSLSNILGGSVPMTIDAHSGVISCTPGALGQYVYAVRVREYRNGFLLGETRREFQVNVINCVGLVVSSIQSPVILCGSLTASFTNNSVGAVSYHWDFGVPSLTNDTSALPAPSYAYPDTGTYTATLIARSALNHSCDDTSTAIVHVYPLLVAKLGIVNDPCINSIFVVDSTVSHSGIPNHWTWDFGDGGISHFQNTFHSYGSVGSFVVTLTVITDAGCNDLVTDTVKIFPLLSANIDTIKPAACPAFCNGIAIMTPHGGTPPYTYLWSDGQITNMADTLCPGNYSCAVTDSNGCVSSSSANISYTFNTLFSNIQAAECDSVCSGSATILAGGGTNPYHYLWSNGDTLASADSLCAGTYIVTVSDSNTCVLSDTVRIVTSFLATIRDSNNVRCFGECNGGATVLAAGGVIPYAYTWSDGQVGATATSWCPGTYVVTTVDVNGCLERDTVHITQPDLLKDSVLKEDARCPLDCNGKGSVNNTGGTTPYVYTWNSLSPQTDPHITGLCPGWHHILTVDAHLCATVDSVFIQNQFSSPPIQTHPALDTVFQGQSTQLFSDPPSGYEYHWLNPGSLNNIELPDPTATPPNTTDYVLRITDDNGCDNYDTLTVYVITGYCKESSIFIPNAFTPDGDGRNDAFFIRAKGISELTFSIFNRWGEKVFESHDMNQGWDGTYKGAPAPPEVYVYYLTTVCYDRNKNFKKGNITLIR